MLNSRHSEPAGNHNRLDVNDLSVRHNPAIEAAEVSPPKVRAAKRILQLEISPICFGLSVQSLTIYSQFMVKIDDDFWPASLAHLIKPYITARGASLDS